MSRLTFGARRPILKIGDIRWLRQPMGNGLNNQPRPCQLNFNYVYKSHMHYKITPVPDVLNPSNRAGAMLHLRCSFCRIGIDRLIGYGVIAFADQIAWIAQAIT